MESHPELLSHPSLDAPDFIKNYKKAAEIVFDITPEIVHSITNRDYMWAPDDFLHSSDGHSQGTYLTLFGDYTDFLPVLEVFDYLFYTKDNHGEPFDRTAEEEQNLQDFYQHLRTTYHSGREYIQRFEQLIYGEYRNESETLVRRIDRVVFHTD